MAVLSFGFRSLPARLRRTGPRRASWAVLTLMVAAAIITPQRPVDAQVADQVRAEADWIMSARFPDGAIANYVDRQAVWPYLSNFAAMGLVRARQVTGDRRYSDAAWQWFGWYQAHMDAQGFITDYVVRNGVLVSTGDMDSTDAYAGTFLLALRDTYKATYDLTRLRQFRTGIAKAVQAIEATQESDGLTWAKPTWKAKYLMDQGETYMGLAAAVELAGILGDSALAQRASNDARRMKAGVDALWNPATAAYDWAVHENGARQPTDWSYLYSDALQQAWAVAFSMVPQPRAGELIAKFHLSQPNWALPAATALISGQGMQSVGYWPEAGVAFWRVSHPAAAAAVTSIRTGALAAKRAWPYTTGNAGQLILFTTRSLHTAPLSNSLLTAVPTTSTTKAPTTTTTAKPATAAAVATTTTAKPPVITTTTRLPATPTPPPATTTTAPPPTTTTTQNLIQRVL